LPYIIHIIGTNGKGSTGRFIASFLQQQNKTVLHYSSPHIVEFNERIWIDGTNSSDIELNTAHKKLQQLLPLNLIEKLTYFEYTTLIALYLSSSMEYLVLEAGLGGEFDATNVVINDLTVITTIDIDHQEFLGNTIEKIATTKMRSCDNAFIISPQVNDEVYKIKDQLLKEKKEIKLKKYPLLEEANSLPNYLQNNLQVALSVLEYLQIDCNNYLIPKLFGRFQKITDNITIDVGHNPLAAKAIALELKKSNEKVILIYNSYKDKDYKEVLRTLQPFIKEIQIIDCDDKRMVNINELEFFIKSLCLNIKYFDIMNIRRDNHYLVFGSFLVVENFLKDFNSL
jgi:dihydrofolate synthase/folylpolyglutamate synthase